MLAKEILCNEELKALENAAIQTNFGRKWINAGWPIYITRVNSSEHVSARAYGERQKVQWALSDRYMTLRLSGSVNDIPMNSRHVQEGHYTRPVCRPTSCSRHAATELRADWLWRRVTQWPRGARAHCDSMLAPPAITCISRSSRPAAVNQTSRWRHGAGTALSRLLHRRNTRTDRKRSAVSVDDGRSPELSRRVQRRVSTTDERCSSRSRISERTSRYRQIVAFQPCDIRSP